MDALLFDTGAPVRRPATAEEIDNVLKDVVRLVVYIRHRGRPPRELGDFEDLRQEVSRRTIERLRRFQHGGKFSLEEYAYVAACYSLTDIQREDMRNKAAQTDELPLFDILKGVA